MSIQRLSSEEADRLGAVGFSYADVGCTASASCPAGFRRLQRSIRVGTGQERFREAARRLLDWDMYRQAGVGVRTTHQHVVEGAVAVLRLGIGRLAVEAPVRVIRVMDEPRRGGFVYGTLPGHPEAGEEAFILELKSDDSVMFTITACSRHATRLARAGGPLTRLVQSWITRRYLHSL